MKVIIAGSRNFHEAPVIERAIKESGFNITEVVSGCAHGVDKLGENWSWQNDIPVKQIPAKWNDWEDEIAYRVKLKKRSDGSKYNVMAGFNRNDEMAQYADALIAVRVNMSRGITDMIDRAYKYKIKVYVLDIERDVK